MDTIACPEWAGAIVQNYRDAFKRKHGHETRLSDDVIYTLYHNNGGVGTVEERDAGVLEDMEFTEKQ